LVAVIAGGAAVMVAMCGRGKLLLRRDEQEGPVQKS
jgi:nitrate reductase gamma subunit